MAQFTVHENKNARTRGAFPYLLDVQSDLLEALDTRVVIPLVKAKTRTGKPITHLMPLLRIGANDYVLLVPQLAGIARRELGASVAVVAQHRTEIVAALDFLITGI